MAIGGLLIWVLQQVVDIVTNPNPECQATCCGGLFSNANASATQFIYE